MRNRGLDEAEGTYITFVDSNPIVFAKDIVGQGIDERNVYQKLCTSEIMNEKRQELLKSRITIEPSFKRFKRKIIETNCLRFIEGMYVGEDFNFCFAHMLASETIDICYKQIYI